MNRSARLWLYEILVPVLIVAAIALWSYTQSSFFLPPLGQIAKAFVGKWLGAGFVDDAVPSMMRWGIAYGISIVIGISLGALFGLNRTAQLLMGPTLELVRVTPPPAILPIAVLAFGIGDGMKIFLIALVCTFPILISTADGVREISQTMRDVARAFNLPFWRIMLPAASPRIFAGLRTSCSLGLVLIALSEMYAAQNGIGYYILNSYRGFDMPSMWSGVIFLGLIGYLVNVLFSRLEAAFLFWHSSIREKAA
jgi:ABC-type nitrate/sulfonate/bicarbonate transport system permease component